MSRRNQAPLHRRKALYRVSQSKARRSLQDQLQHSIQEFARHPPKFLYAFCLPHKSRQAFHQFSLSKVLVLRCVSAGALRHQVNFMCSNQKQYAALAACSEAVRASSGPSNLARRSTDFPSPKSILLGRMFHSLRFCLLLINETWRQYCRLLHQVPCLINMEGAGSLNWFRSTSQVMFLIPFDQGASQCQLPATSPVSQSLSPPLLACA